MSSPSALNVLKVRVKQPQFYWFLGHLMTLYHFIRLHLSFWSYQSQIHHYSMALMYISATYAIVLYQFVKSGQLKLLNFTNVRVQMRSLDNLQYFGMLATLFACSKVGGAIINGALYSPVIFSMFHCLNYFKENLLPILPVNQVLRSVLNNNISTFIASNNASFLQMAQFLELLCCLRAACLILPLNLLKLLLLQWNLQTITTILAAVAYITFAKLRLTNSPSMHLLLQQALKNIDPLVPPTVRQYWIQAKSIIASLYQKWPI